MCFLSSLRGLLMVFAAVCAVGGSGEVYGAPAGEGAARDAAGDAAAPDLMAMQRDAVSGQIVVTCLVAGKPARLVLDTGATHTVVSEAFARRSLGDVPRLDMSKIKVEGNAAGTTELLRTDVVAGGVTFRGLVVLVLQLEGVNELQERPVDGVLGMDVLRHLSFVLDFPGDRFLWGYLRDKSLLEPLEGERDEAGRLFARVSRGDRTLSLLLDTGCSRTVVRPPCWPDWQQEGVRMQMADVNGRREVELPIGQPEALLLSPGVRTAAVSPVISAEREADGLLGLDALRGNLLMHCAGEGERGRFYVGPVWEKLRDRAGTAEAR